MRLIDAPIGLFLFEGCIVLKTEYSTVHDGTVTPDCYTVNGGEYFWGGAKTVEERNNLEVTPIEAEPVRHGRWIDGAENFTCGNYNAECSVCHCNIKWGGCDEDFNYCPNCGAKMDGGIDHA